MLALILWLVLCVTTTQYTSCLDGNVIDSASLDIELMNLLSEGEFESSDAHNNSDIGNDNSNNSTITSTNIDAIDNTSSHRSIPEDYDEVYELLVEDSRNGVHRTGATFSPLPGNDSLNKLKVKRWPTISSNRSFPPLFLKYHNSRVFGSCDRAIHGMKVPSSYNISDGWTNRSPWLELFDIALVRGNLFNSDGETNDQAIVSGGTPAVFVKHSDPRLVYIYETCGAHKFEYFRYFASRVLPLLKKPVVVYSGGSDCHPSSDWSTQKIANSKMVLHWFAENLQERIGQGMKVTGFPLGLCQRNLLTSTQSNPLLHVGIHANASITPWIHRKNMLLPCGFDHHDTKGDRERLVYRLLKNCTVCAKCSNGKGIYASPLEYYEKLSEHRFALSPKGMGVDCYRTFEILLMGSVPVIPMWLGARDFLDAGLPVFLFESPSDITFERLDNFSSVWGPVMSNFTELRRRLSFDYWADILRQKLS